MLSNGGVHIVVSFERTNIAVKGLKSPANIAILVQCSLSTAKLGKLDLLSLSFQWIVKLWARAFLSLISVADPGGLWGGSVEPPFGSLISMKNTDLNVYFCSKVPFRESTNPRSNPPSQNPGSAPESPWLAVVGRFLNSCVFSLFCTSSSTQSTS